MESGPEKQAKFLRSMQTGLFTTGSTRAEIKEDELIKLTADAVKVPIIITRLTFCNSTDHWRRPRYCPAPQPAVTQNPFNHIRLRFTDKTDDLHLPATIRTTQRIHLVYLLDQRRPAHAPLLSESTGSLTFSAILGLRRRLPFLAHPPLLVRIPVTVVNRVLPPSTSSGRALARYVLGHLRQECQWI